MLLTTPIAFLSTTAPNNLVVDVIDFLTDEFSFVETGFHGRVQDGGFTLAFGDLPNRALSSSEGLFLRTNDQVESYMRILADSIERYTVFVKLGLN